MNRTVSKRASRTWSGAMIALSLSIALLIPLFAVAQETISPRQQIAIAEGERKARLFRMLTTGDRETSNQELYDVLYYDLDLDLDPDTELVTGTVSVTAKPESTSIDGIELNLLDNMTVTGVTMSGLPVTYLHSSDILTITLDDTYDAGETFSVTVDYYGTPAESWGGFGFDSRGDEPMIWSLSEPYGARTWWPCKDVVKDKADSVDIRLTVPSDLIAVSNGTLRDTTTVGEKKTYWWHEGYPITTYLVSVAAHPYTTFSDWYHYSPTDSMEIQNYVFPGSYSTVRPIVAETPDMIAFLKTVYGEYPFLNEKYGHAEFLWGGAMEHQTCSSMGFWGQDVVVHELAHQWWGDMVSPHGWNHIWLNEGFATYTEALYVEHKSGIAFYRGYMTDTKYFGPGSIYVYDTSDPGRIMDGNLSYNKANWVLHMLRHVVGDSTFFDITRAYYSDSAVQYGTATTEDFQRVAETVSGMDLEDFFQQWIYGEYYPIYSLHWEYAPSGGGYDVEVRIEQKQTNQIFKMPIDVWIDMTVGDTTFVVQDTLASQTFQFTVPYEPENVKLDKAQGGWILKVVQEDITDPTFDRGILLVNGVDWGTYGTEIFSAYEDSVFWGDNPVTFWDLFAEPSGGYPVNLPAPIGSEIKIPADTLKQFSTVIWVGNNYNGDLDYWANASIQDYLEAGGNLLLMGRMGQQFLHPGLKDHLGITWAADEENTLNSYTTAHPGMTNIAFTGTQSFAAVFDTTFASGETEFLFRSNTASGTFGTGAYRAPSDGGTHRADGGRFVFLSGRPYRMNHDALRGNVDYILSEFFNEPFDATDVEESIPPAHTYELSQNRPNPFNPTTEIRFTTPSRGHVKVKIFDASGRLVRTLADKHLPAGTHTLVWDGTGRNGRSIGSGIYFYRMEAGDYTSTRKMVLVR